MLHETAPDMSKRYILPDRHPCQFCDVALSFCKECQYPFEGLSDEEKIKCCRVYLYFLLLKEYEHRRFDPFCPVEAKTAATRSHLSEAVTGKDAATAASKRPFDPVEFDCSTAYALGLSAGLNIPVFNREPVTGLLPERISETLLKSGIRYVCMAYSNSFTISYLSEFQTLGWTVCGTVLAPGGDSPASHMVPGLVLEYSGATSK